MAVAAWAARMARRLALVAAAAAVVLAAALVADGSVPALATILLVGLLFAPAVMLYAFARAAAEVAELPARLRATPQTAGANAAELARLLRRGEHGPARRTWRLLVLTSSTRELLAPHAPLVALLSPVFLALTAVALLALWIEVVAALVVLVSTL